MWRLYYDGECNLCHSSQLRVVRWARAAGQPLETEILQSPEAEAKGYSGAMTLEADGEVLFAEQAWLRLARLAPGFVGWVAPLLAFPWLRPIVRFGYRTVERNRFRWFGKRTCEIPRQPLPTPEVPGE